MKKITLHPEVFLIENFLSAQECDGYVDKYKNEPFEEAKVSVHGQQVMNKGVRNNDRLLLFDHDLADHLWHKIKEFVPYDLGAYEALGLNEMFRVYKYSPGQRFRMHRDGTYHRNENECSFYSFLIYLNDDFKGGETAFRKLQTILPKKGMALVFRHPHRHEGKELLEGVKYVLRTDIMYRLKGVKK